MTLARPLRKFRSRLRRFARDRSGVTAVEFAIVVPFMLLAYIGGNELGNGLAIKYRVTLAARTVTDLASQYVSIDGATMSSILNASSSVIAPYSSANMVVTVSEITTDANGQGTVTWSDSLNGTPRTVGSSVTLPTALQTPSISLIWGEVTYPYQPVGGYFLTGTINFYQSTYFYPRLSSSIACNGC
ncbi:MAG TPA: TadE/TadG family type IV pilus assembly protein [Xanthobacteraceae bacterium]|nr:TadE/TadG family type IV pilus assembly protein [Xanthobacteraceae bacterium]